MEFALTETNKRRPLLLLDGYEHRYDRMSKDGTKTFFRCILKGCKGRAHAPIDGRHAIMVVQHDHDRNQRRVRIRKHKMTMRRTTENSTYTADNIVKAHRKRARINVTANGPSIARDAKRLQRFRVASNVETVNATRMNNVYFNDESGLTSEVNCSEDSDFGDNNRDKSWSREALILLIREIQMRTALWTGQFDDRRDVLRRDLQREVAQVLSTKLGFSVTCFDVSKKWEQLKSQYECYLKLRERFEKDSFGMTSPQFSFTKHMRFLLDDDDFHKKCFGSAKQYISRDQLDRMPLTLPIASDSTQDEERKEVPLILPTTSVAHDSKSDVPLLQHRRESATQKRSISEEAECDRLNSEEQDGELFSEPYDAHPQCSAVDEPDQSGLDAVEKDSNVRWSRESRIMLIREIRARPVLWASELESRRVTISAVNVLRHQIAQLISATFHIPVTGEAVARQWKYLKVEYRRYLRNLELFEKNGGLNGSKRPIFQYAKYMKFLLDDDVHSRCVGVGEPSVSHEQQSIQYEVLSRISSLDSGGTQDAIRKREPRGHTPIDVLGHAFPTSDFQGAEVAPVRSSTQWLHCGETGAADRIDGPFTETYGMGPQCPLLNEHDTFEEQSITSNQQFPLHEVGTNFWCDDEDSNGSDHDYRSIHWQRGADGSTLPLLEHHLESALAKRNNAQCPDDNEEGDTRHTDASVSKSYSASTGCATIDKYDRFGEWVASAMRKAVEHDPLIAQQFRIDLSKMLFALEESIMNAMLQKR